MTDWMDEEPSCPNPDAHTLSNEELEFVVSELTKEAYYTGYTDKKDGDSVGLFQQGPSLW